MQKVKEGAGRQHAWTACLPLFMPRFINHSFICELTVNKQLTATPVLHSARALAAYIGIYRHEESTGT